ncbi:hypothetical protein ACRAOD_19885 [Raoultella ornithinolytica]|uniref:Uncharacterized protein n=1 Tax=Raoultella ornithinolytica TaxID=54291 RepID=A0A9Q9J921_RAOOR|nr:hypothetical protein [Raoultella ornithinolytica]EKV6727031.1 hypothetical protein [Raoultella ornithinolytica]MCT8169634.1 hypothetical protein [Raoultella ornithinolytica]MDL4580736.1 hypothetical protein [Raoultella ornithinolytica]UXE37139.1 hypothetical protein N2J37_21820 [Raoultella ornithinolytica]
MVKKKMQHVSRITGEIYQCPGNGNTQVYDDIKTDWKCPDCGEYIHICAQSPTGEKATFIRKRADEVVKGDLVKPQGGTMDQFNKVKGITEKDDGTLVFGLEGLGARSFEPDAWITCRTGGEW